MFLLAPIQHVLDYLLYLKQQALAISSIRMHLGAICDFHPPTNNHSLCSNSMSLGILEGLDHLYPQVEDLVPPWDLNLVLKKLMGSPFDQMFVFISSSFNECSIFGGSYLCKESRRNETPGMTYYIQSSTRTRYTYAFIQNFSPK